MNCRFDMGVVKIEDMGTDAVQQRGMQDVHALGSAEALAHALPLTPRELEGAQRAERQGLPLRITPYYLSLVDPNDPACPIRRPGGAVLPAMKAITGFDISALM